MRPSSFLTGAITVPDEKHAFFLNDLVAAAWVAAINIRGHDEETVDAFMRLHESFMDRLGRENKGFFSKIDHDYLSKIIFGWIRLYSGTLDELRSRFPRTTKSTDLVSNGINWSKKLEVSAKGIARIDNASRYAEFWAERSVRDPKVFRTLKVRTDFIGSSPYIHYSDVVDEGGLLVLDQRRNGIPAYDFWEIMTVFRPESAHELKVVVRDFGWTVTQCKSGVIERLVELVDEFI